MWIWCAKLSLECKHSDSRTSNSQPNQVSRVTHSLSYSVIETDLHIKMREATQIQQLSWYFNCLKVRKFKVMLSASVNLSPTSICGISNDFIWYKTNVDLNTLNVSCGWKESFGFAALESRLRELRIQFLVCLKVVQTNFR